MYPGYIRYNEYSKYTGRLQQCIPLVIITVFTGYIRYNEYSKYTGRLQQCIPLVIITICIQGTQGIINKVSI